jgi:hypothetical protein
MTWVIWKLLFKLAALAQFIMRWMIVTGVFWYLATQVAHAVMGW